MGVREDMALPMGVEPTDEMVSRDNETDWLVGISYGIN